MPIKDFCRIRAIGNYPLAGFSYALIVDFERG